MARRARSKSEFTLPPIVPGDWEGEIFGSCSVNLRQVVQPGPPQQSIKFSYIFLTRAKFSDLLRLLEAQRFRTFHFTNEASEQEDA